MKVLIVTTSRADWNGLGMVARKLTRLKIGLCVVMHTNQPDWSEAVNEDVRIYDLGMGTVERACISLPPDVAVVAGDRSELLEACVTLCRYKVPICHIGGGDITTGSMDDRYRDAITALATIHCAETAQAAERLVSMARHGVDYVSLTGMPGLDRIRITNPIPAPQFLMSPFKPNVLLLVHPNTTHAYAAFEVNACIEALKNMDVNVLPFECNKDPGHELVNARLTGAFRRLISNRPPAEFYWLLQHCDVLVGNSSAGTAEAPCFGIPVVNVGDRQKGRVFGPGAACCAPSSYEIEVCVKRALLMGRAPMWLSPYGDGHAAEKIVDALEANSWRWSNATVTEPAKAL